MDVCLKKTEKVNQKEVGDGPLFKLGESALVVNQARLLQLQKLNLFRVT